MRTGEQQSEQGNAWLATWLARFFINLWNTKMKSISFQKSFHGTQNGTQDLHAIAFNLACLDFGNVGFIQPIARITFAIGILYRL